MAKSIKLNKTKRVFFQVTVKSHRIDEKCDELHSLGHEIVTILPHLTKGDFYGDNTDVAYDYIIVSKVK